MSSCEVIVVLLAVFSVAQLNPVEPFFRKDYNYVGRQEAFYKLHTDAKTWPQARLWCAREGASLAYPETQSEATLLTTYMSQYLTKKQTSNMWLGAHDLFYDGIFVNFQGKDLSSMYSIWTDDQRTTDKPAGHCVVMKGDGTLNAEGCETRRPYICKKTIVGWTSNPICETTDPAYVPNDDNSRCYKVHTTPMCWKDAYATCHAEQSYLTIINNKKEANFLVELMKKTPEDKNVKTPYHKGHISIGFHDIFHEGEYLTIHGQTLQQAGYTEWQGGMPDNYNRAEDCGSITRDGTLNDINCDGTAMWFICERELGDPNIVDLFSRYGNQKSLA